LKTHGGRVKYYECTVPCQQLQSMNSNFMPVSVKPTTMYTDLF
jgi:hypothetical protein